MIFKNDLPSLLDIKVKSVHLNRNPLRQAFSSDSEPKNTYWIAFNLERTFKSSLADFSCIPNTANERKALNNIN
jgi:hypothetical protein